MLLNIVDNRQLDPIRGMLIFKLAVLALGQFDVDQFGDGQFGRVWRQLVLRLIFWLQ